MEIERHEYFMNQAFAEAELAFEAGEVPVGAVVVHEGMIVGRGHNRLEATGDPTAHAEILALGAASDHFESWRLLGATMYCTLEPCPMCAGAAVLARLRRLVFGAYDPKFGGCGSIFNIPVEPKLNHQMEVIGGYEQDRAIAMMKEFFARRRASGTRYV